MDEFIVVHLVSSGLPFKLYVDEIIEVKADRLNWLTNKDGDNALVVLKDGVNLTVKESVSRVNHILDSKRVTVNTLKAAKERFINGGK